MALILDATPKSATANSNCTVEDADNYHDTVRPADAAIWSLLGEDDKARYLVTATSIIDNSYQFQGLRTNPLQMREWPRMAVNREGFMSSMVADGSVLDDANTENMVYLDPNVMPQFLINATSELARLLSVKNTVADVDQNNIKIAKSADGSMVEFRDNMRGMGAIPTSVDLMIRKYGSLMNDLNDMTPTVGVVSIWRA